MDHLPPVSKPYKPVVVPYLGGEYDGLPFATYPQRQNVDISRLQQGDLQGKTREEVAIVLQTWLYFGMLHEYLGQTIVTADFVQDINATRRLITTAKLPGYMTRWREQIDTEKTFPNAASLMTHRVQRYRTLFDETCRIWRNFGQFQEREGQFPLIPPEVALSIQILAGTLEHSVTWSHIVDIQPGYTRWQLTTNPWLDKRMTAEGWCPMIFRELQRKGRVSLQYYASSLRCPSASPSDHLACVQGLRGCIAKNVDNDTYKTQHAINGCSCDFLRVDHAKLCDILAKGDIPLLCWTPGSDGLSLTLAPFKAGMKYTAISHVWADGMGNPSENSLPSCQIQRVLGFLEALPPMKHDQKDTQLQPSPKSGCTPSTDAINSQNQPKDREVICFWLDTLCVPVQPHSYRKIAIKSMHKTYKNSQRVLVLEADLTNTTAHASYPELLTHISASTWLRRLWTLQEAVLAQEIFVQFAERAESLSISARLKAAQKADIDISFWCQVSYHCDQFNFDLYRDWNYFNVLQRIHQIWLQLSHRGTSHSADEVTCLATLLALDEEQFDRLLDTPTASRYQAFWDTHFAGIPATVLFLPGPKIITPGYRWAPASLLDCAHSGVPSGVEAMPTPRGLTVTLPGILLSTPEQPTEAVIACKLNGLTYYTRRNMKFNSPSWEGIHVHNIPRLAVILGQDPARFDPEVEPLTACVGALVEVESEEEGCFYVRFLRLVSVRREGTYFDRFPEPAWEEVEVVEKGRIGTGRYVEREQRWCVG